MAEVAKSNLYEIEAGILPKDACVVIVGLNGMRNW